MNVSDIVNYNDEAMIARLCDETGMANGIPCSDEDPLKHPISIEILVWFAFSSLITVSLVGNGIVMWIIWSYKTMQYGFNFFLFNMAMSDFLITLLNCGSTWTFNFYNYEWYYPNIFCRLNQLFGVAPSCSSLFSLIVISHDRCLAIINPLRKKAISKKDALIIILLIWVFSCLISLPSIFGAKVIYFYSRTADRVYKRKRTCQNDFLYQDLYEDVLFIVQYVCPLIVLTYTYIRIFRVLNNYKFPNLSSQMKVSGNHMREKKKAVKMLGLIISIFMICWLPYQLYHMINEDFKFGPHVKIYSYLIFYWLAMSSTMYNPIIYCVFNVRFRIGFSYIFRWLPCINFTEDHHNKMFPGSRNTTVRMQKLTASVSTPLKLSSSPPSKRSNKRSQSPNSATSLTLI